ncbi:hypothetical protein CRG98_020677 [Punica granatum]|uniref:Uncharacterized protein n=1 Tax=Punica granatum TaxID=22663 RepID=A0A2I0JRS4_PUNGR|nr:hypothetical protein CRG98_020677 [Punica granatum]
MTPLTEMLLPSVAPEVRTISLGEALIRTATWARADSTARSDFQPQRWVREWRFPYRAGRGRGRTGDEEEEGKS